MSNTSEVQSPNGQAVADQWYAQQAAQRPQAVQVPAGYVLVPAPQPAPQPQPVAAGPAPQLIQEARRERRQKPAGGQTAYDAFRALPGWGKTVGGLALVGLMSYGLAWQVGGYLDRQVAASVAASTTAMRDDVLLPATAKFVDERMAARIQEAQGALTVAVISDPMSPFKCPTSAAAKALIGTDPADPSGQRPHVQKATSVAQQVSALLATPGGVDLRVLRIAAPSGGDPNPRVTTNPADAQLFACA